MQDQADYKVKSLAKALSILECFTLEAPQLGATEIANKLKLPKSTVFNVLSTFEQWGYVQQNPQTRKYSLGLSMLHFSYIINSHLGYRKIFHEYLTEIAQQCNETCYVAIPYDDIIVYIDAAFPKGYVNIRSISGERAPMYCTAIGKALLAFMPPQVKDAVTAKGLTPFTEYTIVDTGRLNDEMLKIRQQGYAIDNMEHEFGISCVAVPVFGADGHPIAAVSVSGPSLRFDSERIASHVQTIQRIIQPLQHTL